MTLGFIMMRHVTSPETNQYWMECYHRIRSLYPENWILIVDDASQKEHVQQNFTMRNCRILQSEYPRAGELLGYYYFHKTRLFTQAVVLHDSVFLQQPLPKVQNPVTFLWHFKHDWDEPWKEEPWLRRLRHSSALIDFYGKKEYWYGCFGVQSMVQLDFIDFLEKKYNLFSLLPHIKTRADRMCIERVWGALCTMENSRLQKIPSLFGTIHDFGLPWGYSFQHYRQRPATWQHLPIVKVWTGR